DMTRTLFPIVLLLVALTGAGLSLPASAEDAGAAPAPAAASLPAISVAEVGERMLTDIVRASGLVEPVERVLVQPQIEGQAIEAIEAEVGDRVIAGQILARLSDKALKLQESQLVASRAGAEAGIAQAAAQMTETRAAAEDAKRTSDRVAALRAQGNSSQAAADQATTAATAALARATAAEQGLAAAEAQLALVDAQIANVRLQLQRTLIVAPVAGVVSDRNAMTGAIASAAAQPMFTIERDGLLELRADLAEQDLLRVAEGQTARLFGVGLGAPLTGTVRLVEPTINTQTRLARVRIAIDAPETVRAGMFLEAEIVADERTALAVPLTAVGAATGETTVMRVVDGTVERATVVTGIRENGWIEVLDGVSAGDLVVAKAGAFVRSGDRVNPVPMPAAPGATN